MTRGPEITRRELISHIGTAAGTAAALGSCGLPVGGRPVEFLPTAERGKESPVRIYACDPHSLDKRYNHSPDWLLALYHDVARDGVNYIRYDFKWSNIEKRQGTIDDEQLARYSQARDLMKQAGLGEPTIILSNIPDWAVALYRKDKEAFFDAWRTYVRSVRHSLDGHEGKVEQVQVLNELNVSYYTPVRPADIPRLCDITKEEFQSYNPAVVLSATIMAGNMLDLASRIGWAVSANEFIQLHRAMLRDNFPILAVDCYPGLWYSHLPIREARWKPKDMFKQLHMLKEVFEDLASWADEYQLGEVGLPTKLPWEGERTQRYFYNVFFRALRHMLLDFQRRGVKLPSAVGMYEVIDRKPTTPREKLAKMFTAEYDFGVRRLGRERKAILQPSSIKPGVSQLGYLIGYLNKPPRPPFSAT